MSEESDNSREILTVSTGRITKGPKQTVRLVFEVRPGDGPASEIWFEVARHHEDMLNPNGAAGLVSSVTSAMRLGQDIRSETPPDAVLAANIQTAQSILSFWYDQLEQVSIEEPGDAPIDEAIAPGVGVFFSSGLDSLHATRRVHALEGYRPEGGSGYLVPVHGFDVHYDDAETFAEIETNAHRLAEEIGWQAVPVRTNVKLDWTDQRTDWVAHSHGSALAAVGHVLSGGLGRCFLGSSYQYDQLGPWGSSPLIDSLWSSRRMLVTNIGGDRSRIDKLRELRDWPFAVNLLRVCGHAAGLDTLNCGQCEKCARTIINLYAADLIELVEDGLFPRADAEAVEWAARQGWSRGPHFLKFWRECYEDLRTQPGKEHITRLVHRKVRSADPSGLRRVVRDLDKRILGGRLDRLDSAVRRRLGLK